MAPTPHTPLATAAAPAAVASARVAKVPSWFTVQAAMSVAQLKRVEHLIVMDRQRVVGAVAVDALLGIAADHPIARVMVPNPAAPAPVLQLLAVG
jgi:hypothetical protein